MLIEHPRLATLLNQLLKSGDDQIAPREKLGIQVVGVRCALSDTVTVPPDPLAPLKDSDAAIVAGPDEKLRRLHGKREQ